MKRFAFRLQRILELRQAREKACMIELGRERQRLQLENERLHLFQNEQKTQLEETKIDRMQVFQAWSQVANSRYLTRVGRAIDFQTQAVHQQERNVEVARHRYQERRRDTQILDQLREKKRDEWRAETLHEEAVNLDEIGSRKKTEW